MDRLITQVIAVMALIFFVPVIGTLFGAFSGWVVGLFFGNYVHAVVVGIFPQLASFSLTQIGAGLGFFGAFVRSMSYSERK